jgi:hypothetical protein
MTNRSIHQAVMESRRLEREQFIRDGTERGLSSEEFIKFIGVSEALGWRPPSKWAAYKSHAKRVHAYIREEGKPVSLSIVADTIAADMGIDRDDVWGAGSRDVKAGKLDATYKKYGKIDRIDLVALPEWESSKGTKHSTKKGR